MPEELTSNTRKRRMPQMSSPAAKVLRTHKCDRVPPHKQSTGKKSKESTTTTKEIQKEGWKHGRYN
jgi:hypothetical protein